ncbi:hypothetical protein F5Y14DRAFT_424750 [Nemania sp. NC0429]|nr:hypothetical protein F5Y14DRAFT_424750 [Nemania sp. NC0429]
MLESRRPGIIPLKPEILSNGGPSRDTGESSIKSFRRPFKLGDWGETGFTFTRGTRRPIADSSHPEPHTMEEIEGMILETRREISYHQGLEKATTRQAHLDAFREAKEAAGEMVNVKFSAEQGRLNLKFAELHRSLDTLLCPSKSKSHSPNWTHHARDRLPVLKVKDGVLCRYRAALRELDEIARQQAKSNLKPWYGWIPGCNKPSRAEMRRHFTERNEAATGRLQQAAKELSVLDWELIELFARAVQLGSANSDASLQSWYAMFESW